MEVAYAFLADAATVDAGGKLNALGIFDSILVRSFPANHARLYVVLSLRTWGSEAGTHRLRLLYVDGDGKPLLPPIEHEFTAPARAASQKIIVEVNGLPLPAAGPYSFEAAVDGHHMVSLPLNVTGGPAAV